MIYRLMFGFDKSEPDADVIKLRFLGRGNECPVFNGSSLNDNWLVPSYSFVYDEGELYNFISIDAIDTFLCDADGRDFLVSLLKNKIEILPFVKIQDRDFFVVNLLNVVEAVDFDKSIPIYLPEPNRKLWRFEPFVFSWRKVKDELLFKESTRPTNGIYCTQTFRDLYEKSGLIGIAFTKIGDFTVGD